LKALVQLKKVGIFACAVIKKSWYWPALVPGEAINREFDDLELKVGDSLAISGKLDGEEYFFWALKEPSYIMKVMATGVRYLQMIVVESRSRGGLKGGSRDFGHFDSSAHTTGITSSDTPLMITTTCIMLSLQLSIRLPQLVGRCMRSPLYSR
jgi:hypothetical protein